MSDIQEILEINREHYKHYRESMPVLDEFIMSYNWMMASDEKERISLSLRVGKEKPRKEYEEVMRGLIGKPADDCVTELLERDDEELRPILVTLSNLMSKPFNTAERLADRGITRTPGRMFCYEVTGKKVGIIGYGLYNDFFYGKCAEFHAFDFRPERSLITRRIGKKTRSYPVGIQWHLGSNALEHRDILRELDIVIMTGCTIVNDTYRELLEACKNAKIRGIYGPSSELTPEYLFDLGYNYIFSGSVKNKEEFLEEICDPLPKGNNLLYMDTYELVKS